MRYFLLTLFLTACSSAPLPIDDRDAGVDASDGGPCGELGERCCSAAEAAQPCSMTAPFGCGVEGRCCAIGAGGHCAE